VFPNPLVKSFISSANQNDLFLPGKLGRYGLVEDFPLGRQQNHQRGLPGLFYRSHRPRHRLDFHDHSAAAAVGSVVRHAVFVLGPIADVMQADLDQPLFPGLFQKAELQGRLQHFRKNGQNVKSDHGRRPSRRLMIIFFPATSTCSTTPAVAGIRISPASPRQT